MNYQFPRTIFVNTNGLVKQLEHIQSEVDEAVESSTLPDIEHTGEEVMDIYATAETALRILEEKYGLDIQAIRAKVITKNFKRGYYASTVIPRH